MTVQEALQVYNIPFAITEHNTAAGCESFRLAPVGSSATITRLKTRLDDIIAATGQPLEVVSGIDGIMLKVVNPLYFNYMDYNGYIDYNCPDIPFLVGMSNGQIITDTIDNARQMLVAGTTGSGKSVFLHTLITTFCCNPHNYLFLVDCKQVEFNIYKNYARVAVDVFGKDSAATYTNYLIEVMQDRFSDMERAGVNDFKDYKKLYPDARRYILVIDELADMISDKAAQKIIIPRLLRIAQKGRAAGIHLILSTQRPDSTIINGTLKGNIPTRLAFRTISNMDSRIILDQSGAEHLNRNGDGLYLKNGAFDLLRIQAPFIDLQTIKQIQEG